MPSIDRTGLDAALAALGALLEARGLHYEVVAVGGGNLILQGLVTRPTTKDVDLLGEWTGTQVVPMHPMPEALRTAVVDVANTYGLAPDWVNLGPESLLDLGLPDGFEARLDRRDYEGLVLWLASRFDMICFKLYAAADQGQGSRHFQDLQDLTPTLPELTDAAAWAVTQDASDGFRSLLVPTLHRLGVEDSDGIG